MCLLLSRWELLWVFCDKIRYNISGNSLSKQTQWQRINSRSQLGKIVARAFSRLAALMMSSSATEIGSVKFWIHLNQRKKCDIVGAAEGVRNSNSNQLLTLRISIAWLSFHYSLLLCTFVVVVSTHRLQITIKEKMITHSGTFRVQFNCFMADDTKSSVNWKLLKQKRVLQGWLEGFKRCKEFQSTYN